MTGLIQKIVPRAEALHRVAALPRPVVFTNGVFDLLHRGHVIYLEQARSLGASLMVALNTDASARRLGKGPHRPLNAQLDRAVVIALVWIMIGSLIGNFVCGALAKWLGYRRTIFWVLLAYFVVMWLAFHQTWSWEMTKFYWCLIGACQGVFGLFTMCLPPLFPVLLRTSGAGFCYNIGRIIAAAGTVFFGVYQNVPNVREALLAASWLFIPAAFISLLLPEEKDQDGEVNLVVE